MNNLGGEGKLSPPAYLNFHLSKTGKYSIQKMDVIKEQGTSGRGSSKKRPERKTLDVWHYSTLSLIARLTNIGEKPCSHKQLRDIFLWRHPKAENKFDDTILTTLDDVGLIKRSLKEDELKSRIIALTDLGKQKLAEIREARRKDIAVIVAKLEVADENSYQQIIDTLSHLGDELWECMLEEAALTAIKSRGEIKKQPKRK